MKNASKTEYLMDFNDYWRKMTFW